MNINEEFHVSTATAGWRQSMYSENSGTKNTRGGGRKNTSPVVIESEKDVYLLRNFRCLQKSL